MKTFSVNGTNGSYTVNLPTSLNEITPEYLAACVEHVSPAPDYSVVAVVYREALNVILNSFKKKVQSNISIVPKFIKSGTTDSQFVSDLSCGDTIIINGSDISLGHHISSPLNKITIDNIVAICNGDKDVWQDVLTWHEPCYFVEFKLVPNNTIHGKLGNVTKMTTATTFIYPTNEAKA